MNYYLDFDNTLYNTPELTKNMLDSIVNSIKTQNNFSKDELLKECNIMFNRENIYNIYELVHFFSDKYKLNKIPILNSLNNIILDGHKFVFNDTIPFLENLKSHGHKLYLLSYCKESLQYQSAKISGSQITSYFDALFITSQKKYNLDIDYTNGIFIDDNPDDLLNLYSKKPKEVIRLRRKENKYSVINLENINIKEYTNLFEISIN